MGVRGGGGGTCDQRSAAVTKTSIGDLPARGKEGGRKTGVVAFGWRSRGRKKGGVGIESRRAGRT